MWFQTIVAALWIISKTALAIPINARYAIERRENDDHPINPKVFIIDMVIWIKPTLGLHEI